MRRAGQNRGRRRRRSARSRPWRIVVVAVLLIVAAAGGALALRNATGGGDEEGGRSSQGSAANPTSGIHPTGGRADRTPDSVELTVEASGDLLIHAPVWEEALSLGGGDSYDFAPLFSQIRPYVSRADLALCHVETPMTPAPPTSYPIFNTPPALAQGIAATGWDACDTASNHSLDQGQSGIDETGKALDAAHVQHTGSFPSVEASSKPLILNASGVKVAFLAYTTDTNGIPAPNPWSVALASPDRILADAREAKKDGADAVIVNLHWGGGIVPEYQAEPSAGQLDLVKKLTASPLVTAIVGQGPHAVQPTWKVNDKWVVFSEGNLVSNQSPEAGLPAASQDGMVALLHLTITDRDAQVDRVSYVPVWVRHPDYTVLPIGRALAQDEADSAALRASYQRTVRVVGQGDGKKPIPQKLP